jgi:hypothetical protein
MEQGKRLSQRSKRGKRWVPFLVVLVLVTGKTGCVFVCAVEIGSKRRWKGDFGEGKPFGEAASESDSDTIKRQRVCGARPWTWTHVVGRVLLLGAKIEVAVGLESQHLLGLLAWSTGLVCQSSSAKLIPVDLKTVF